jgi:hypothetical protein
MVELERTRSGRVLNFMDMAVGYLQGKSMTRSDFLAKASLRVRQNAAHATLMFLTTAAYSELFSRQLRVKFSIGDGIFCIDAAKATITQEQLDAKVREIIATVKTLDEVRIPRDELYWTFRRHGEADKIGILKCIPDAQVKCVRYGSFVDYVLEPMHSDLREIGVFGFQPYEGGLIVRFAGLLAPDSVSEWKDPGAQYRVFQEYDDWGALAGVEYVAQLNRLIYQRDINDLKWTCEGLHTKKFSRIAGTLPLILIGSRSLPSRAGRPATKRHLLSGL